MVMEADIVAAMLVVAEVVVVMEADIVAAILVIVEVVVIVEAVAATNDVQQDRS